MTKSVAVIGGGITGVTTAYQMALKGFNVTLVEGRRYAGMETSFANGGQLSACNSEVWTSWSTVLTGMKWLFKKDAPLLLRMKPSWHKYSWLTEFLTQIPNHKSNTQATARLAIQSRDAMKKIAEEASLNFDWEKRGMMHVYTDQAAFEKGVKVNKWLNEAGLDRRQIEADEIHEIEPTIKGDFIGGFFTPSDTSGDIHKFSFELAEACLKMGVKFMYDTRVLDIVHHNGRPTLTLEQSGAVEGYKFDSVVICAGVGSRELAAKAGDRVNVYPVKGYSITVNLNDEASQQAAPWVALIDDKAKIVTSRLGKDRFRVAGTAEFNGFNRDIRADRVQPLIDWSEKHFPEMSTEHVVPWAGLRPMMPSMLPKVGAGKRPGIFYNTGHGHLGWTLSSITSELVAEAVASR